MWKEEEELGVGGERERERHTEGGEPERSHLGGQEVQMGGLEGQESFSRMGHRPQVGGDGQLVGDGMCVSVQRLRKDQVVWRKERNENT